MQPELTDIQLTGADSAEAQRVLHEGMQTIADQAAAQS